MKYKQLDDYEFLYNSYTVNKLSATAISKLVGAKSSNSVRQALLRFKIPLRGIENSLNLYHRLEDNFIIDSSSIVGSLLGDGSLQKRNKSSSLCYPIFKRKNKYFSHVKFMADILNISESCIRLEKSRYTYKGLTRYNQCYLFYTNSSKTWIPYYEKWYPESNGYKKSLPEDVVLDCKALLYWFLDDGYSYFRKDRNGRVKVGLCSEAFSERENDILASLLYTTFGLNFRVARLSNINNQFRLTLPTSESDLFFKIIGSCPVKELQYKWKSKETYKLNLS